LKDEAMFLNEARRKGLEEGRKEGLEEGLEKGERLGIHKTAIQLIQKNLLSSDQIAEVTGLEVTEIEKLKRSLSG
jgi:predicted transposase YdaD